MKRSSTEMCGVIITKIANGGFLIIVLLECLIYKCKLGFFCSSFASNVYIPRLTRYINSGKFSTACSKNKVCIGTTIKDNGNLNISNITCSISLRGSVIYTTSIKLICYTTSGIECGFFCN